MENPLKGRLPEAIYAGAILTGIAGAVDTFTGGKYGIRNTLPEPFDLPDHGMSMAMGAAISGLEFHLYQRKDDIDQDVEQALDSSLPASKRHEGISTARRKIAGCAVGAIAAASMYITIGEAGSEAIHFLHDRKQEDIPVEDREKLPLGHLDPLDLMYGIGTAVAITKLQQSRSNQTLDRIEKSLPPLKPRRALKGRSTKPSPRSNKRYTPPKDKR